MTKAETLQKYLTCHTTYGDFKLCKDCPYNPHPGKIWEFGCAHGQDRMIEDAIKLLKEQEPIKPTINEYGEAYCVCGENVGIIPNSKSLPKIRSKYCSECGRRMKWDG